MATVPPTFELTETPTIPKELEEPIEALGSRDPETAFEALSSSLKEKLPLSDLKFQEDWLEGIESVEPVTNPQENPDGTVSVLVEVHFKDGLEPLQSLVTLIKEEGEWKILSTEIYYGPP
ncbi:hypothetical protein A3K78_02980 [Candidatus Bathyarchaeota archaeon RBG_13_52_12]|nr:MAG: hypothetical protein A3K78_02980 [Candidatus Bathyarchaeota archaeon RBG_13_52_12]